MKQKFAAIDVHISVQCPVKLFNRWTRRAPWTLVIIMDEVDKMSMDFRGRSHRLHFWKCLIPKKHRFQWHYIELIMIFQSYVYYHGNVRLPSVAFAGRMEIMSCRIPWAWKERDSPSAIIMKQLQAHGLNSEEVQFEETAILKIIQEYTREAGVRNLEREIASICRKVAKEMVLAKQKMASQKAKNKKQNPCYSRSADIFGNQFRTFWSNKDLFFIFLLSGLPFFVFASTIPWQLSANRGNFTLKITDTCFLEYTPELFLELQFLQLYFFRI